MASRNRKIGLNFFRIRYSDLKHHLSKLAFEDNVLTAKLNGTDVGNINNSRKFVQTTAWLKPGKLAKS